MIVEFFGPEGSGKSTTVRRVAKRRPDAHIRKANGNHRLKHGDRLTASEMRRQRVLAPMAIPSVAWACMAQMTDRRALDRVVDLCRREWFTRQASRLPGINLLDEGPLHRLLVFSSRGYIRDHEALWHRFSPPDLAVFVVADGEHAVLRLTERARKLQAPVRDRWRPTHDKYRELAQWVIDTAPYPVLKIDTTDGVDASKTVSRWIDRQLASLSESRDAIPPNRRSPNDHH